MEEQAFIAFERLLKTNSMHFDTFDEFDGFIQSFDVCQQRKQVMLQQQADGKLVHAYTERISSNEYKLVRQYKEIAHHAEMDKLLRNFSLDDLFSNLGWEMISPWRMV